MSEVYILEPPTNGKVILHTTHGNLDIELWAKECPKASRNFLQLCTDGYYDDTMFHRVIKDFIVQGGDPTGTGKGGESIFGDQPFATEIHPRLKFRYRGLVALASIDSDDQPENPNINQHGSQFFITLSRADFLNGKHTIFGKVTGHSLYNLLSIADVQVDAKTDRPVNPIPKIKSTEVLYSPFDDLQPRPNSRALRIQNEEIGKSEQSNKKKKSTIIRGSLSSRKTNLLSFDDEGERLAAENSRKAEDVLEEKPSVTDDSDRHEFDGNDQSSGNDHDATENGKKLTETIKRLKERIASKRDETTKEIHEENVEEDESSDGDESESSEEETELTATIESRKKNAEQIENLKKQILGFKKGLGTSGMDERESERVQDADLLKESEKRRRLLMNRSRQTGKRQRDQNTMMQISEFTKRLRDSTITPLVPISLPDAPLIEHSDTHQHEDDEDDNDWLNGDGLKFAVDSARAYEIDAAKDALVTFDPLAMKSKEEINERMRSIRSQRMKPSLRRENDKSWI